MSNNKVKSINEKDYEVLELLYKFKYLDLSFFYEYVFKNFKYKRNVLTRLKPLVENRLLIKFSYAKTNVVDSTIYTLSNLGYETIKDKYDTRDFDKKNELVLRKGFEHSIILAHIHHRALSMNNDTKVYTEKEMFHKLDIMPYLTLRPDGALLLNDGTLLLLEYEHSNTRRNLFLKLNRYTEYVKRSLYLNNYSLIENKDKIKRCAVVLVCQKSLSDQSKINIKSLGLEYPLLYIVLDKMLKDPTNIFNYIVLKS